MRQHHASARRSTRSRRVPRLALVLSLGGAPAIARWYVSNRLLPSIGRALKRTVSAARVTVRPGRVVLYQLAVRGSSDDTSPLLVVPEVQIQYRTLSLLSRPVEVRRVTLHQPRLSLVRRSRGVTNFLDLVRRRSSSGSSSGGKMLVGAVELVGGRITVQDELEAATVSVQRVDGVMERSRTSTLRLGSIRIASPRVPSALLFSSVQVHLRGRKVERVAVEGGEVQLLPRLRLSAIRGTITVPPASLPEVHGGARQTRVALDLEGSYGGADARLWSATGWVSPRGAGKLHLRAARFSLGRIASILGRTPVILPQPTMIAGRLDLQYARRQLAVSGRLGVERLSLFHPRLARTPVLDLSAVGQVDARLDLSRRQLQLRSLTIASRGIEARLSGTADWSGEAPHVTARLEVPEVACQQVVQAFPPSLVPAIQGFQLKGQSAMDLHADIDFSHPDRLDLGGKVDIRRCKVTGAPEAVSAERLRGPFEQQVEPTPRQYLVFTVGPENESFAPYASISPNVVHAFLTTEDGGFFRHHGFIPSMFEKALARNLQHGGFRLGASTITMQMVKNVLLTHDKTLSRKLQELFLTWYLEQELSKDRMMEIYLNVIEFGPGIYGIGNASRHYFGKLPAEISPLEAAFFASILPAPRRRYIQYCHGQLTEKWDHYVRRILRRMASKAFVSEQAMKEAESQTLTFNRDLEGLPEKECIEQVKELGESWLKERERLLREAILRAAPHQVSLFFPPTAPVKVPKR